MNLKKIFGFKGEGTKGSPVIFDEFRDILLEITIKTKGLNLVLRNLTISKLRIINSQNVAIENCFVGKLITVRCRNLAFRNNSIVHARQLLRRSYFPKIIVCKRYGNNTSIRTNKFYKNLNLVAIASICRVFLNSLKLRTT